MTWTVLPLSLSEQFPNLPKMLSEVIFTQEPFYTLIEDLGNTYCADSESDTHVSNDALETQLSVNMEVT